MVKDSFPQTDMRTVEEQKESSRPANKELISGLNPPRFSLKALFGFTAICCGVLAVGHWFGPACGAVCTLLFVGAGAHVAGNVLGTRLRDGSSQHLRGVSDPELTHMRARRVRADDFAPATVLRESSEWARSLWIFTGVISTAAAALGGTLLTYFLEQRATMVNIGFGTLICALLGGLWGFLGGRAAQIVRHAWNHAQRNG